MVVCSVCKNVMAFDRGRKMFFNTAAQLIRDFVINIFKKIING